MTKITIENKYGSVMVIDNKDDMDVFEITELIKKALLGLGYHFDSINALFDGEVDDS